MCGRYYVDDETSREIEKIVRKLDQRLKIEHGQDIHPSESAVVLTKECREVAARQMQWGFPGFQGKGLLINARAEAILDKKTFRDSVLHRRCVIPARHFYEWNKNQRKSILFKAKSRIPYYLWQGVIKSIMVKIGL